MFSEESCEALHLQLWRKLIVVNIGFKPKFTMIVRLTWPSWIALAAVYLMYTHVDVGSEGQRVSRL